MNDILELKGKFEGKKGKPNITRNIPSKTELKIEHMQSLLRDLKNIIKYWDEIDLEIDPIVSVKYKGVVAKSNRMSGIITNNKKNRIVGAKFVEDKFKQAYQKKHVITHCITKDLINESIKILEKVIIIISKKYGEKISHEEINELNKSKNKEIEGIKISKIISIIVDSYYIEKFTVEENDISYRENAIINIYDTGVKTEDIMKKLGIDFINTRKINETTLLLAPDQIELLKEKAPYLISMAVADLAKISPYKSTDLGSNSIIKIPKPGNEPTIGVIDTAFDKRVYFSEWVEYIKMIPDEIELKQDDYFHGTAVSSIIVDGANINPNFDDGCGRFKVRHFCVANHGRFSSFTILKQIKEIVEKNKDIKVWNLSLGSTMEIDPNFISPEAAILDDIQYKNDVIFIIAGTNKNNNDKKGKKIGAPADSINSIVVNSVDINNNPTYYTRDGIVLSFYTKPDVAYYGGPIRVCAPNGEAIVEGTSFSAPWIARKMSYMIDILGLSREVAKALLIDSSVEWKSKSELPEKIGYGVVPIDIKNIIHSKDDEIKFTILGETILYETYNYKIPVPRDKDKQPYVAKATMCYFPKCSRNQGVDYTNTELDLHFGKINKLGKVSTINENKQSEEGSFLLYEENVRKNFRKWDNVKHIIEYEESKTGKKRRGKMLINDGSWGINIKTKERISTKNKQKMKFGLVVTLKEINGKNRIETFIEQCYLKGWLVNRINVENKIDIYNKAEEIIEFE